MDLLIFSGQSNMQGSTGSFPTEPKVKTAKEYKFLTDEYVTLSHPTGENIGNDILWQASEGNGSLIPAFCREYSKKCGEVLAVQVARGNTSIEEWLKGTERFDVVIKKVKSAIKKAKEQFTVDKIYFIWLQGESNAIMRTETQDYLNMLTALKNDLKKEIDFDKFCIIKVGYFASYADWVEGSTKEKSVFDERIMKAQESAVKNDDDFIMLTRICTKLSKNKKLLNNKEFGPHYNNDAMIIIGKKAGKALSKFRRK